MPFNAGNYIETKKKSLIDTAAHLSWHFFRFVSEIETFTRLGSRSGMWIFFGMHTRALPWNCAHNLRRRVVGSPRGRASRAWGTGSRWRSRSSSPRIWRALNRGRGNSEKCTLVREFQRDGVCSWLTNSALVYEPKCGGREGVAGSQPMSTAVHRSPNKLGRSNSIFNLRLLQIRVIYFFVLCGSNCHKK